MRRAKGGAKIFGVFRVKNHDFTPKNHIFSNCGGRHEHFWGISCEKSRFYAKKSYFFSNFRKSAPGIHFCFICKVYKCHSPDTDWCRANDLKQQWRATWQMIDTIENNSNDACLHSFQYNWAVVLVILTLDDRHNIDTLTVKKNIFPQVANHASRKTHWGFAFLSVSIAWSANIFLNLFSDNVHIYIYLHICGPTFWYHLTNSYQNAHDT